MVAGFRILDARLLIKVALSLRQEPCPPLRLVNPDNARPACPLERQIRIDAVECIHHSLLSQEAPMKGNAKLIETLNSLLADELTAINQYMVHSEMCANWGYERLHQAVEKRARQEMHHAEKLIARIIFLDGTPTVSRLNQIHVGADVPKQLQSDK